MNQDTVERRLDGSFGGVPRDRPDQRRDDAGVRHRVAQLAIETLQQRIARVNEGDLDFIPGPSQGVVHHHRSRIFISDTSLLDGWVRLEKCHVNLDRVAAAQIDRMDQGIGRILAKLRELGIESIMVNSNPETVSTDYDTSDLLFFEPLTTEDVLNICDRMQPDGVIVQFGGQTPLNLARGLAAAGVPIIGTSVDTIAMLTTLDINSKFIENEKGGRIFVVSGKVRNGYPVPCNKIQLQGKLFAKGKVLAKTELVYAGVMISDLELAGQEVGQIKQRLRTGGGQAAELVVNSGQSLPFMVVFSDLPADLDEFAIELLSSTKVQ